MFLDSSDVHIRILSCLIIFHTVTQGVCVYIHFSASSYVRMIHLHPHFTMVHTHTVDSLAKVFEQLQSELKEGHKVQCILYTESQPVPCVIYIGQGVVSTISWC